MTDGASPDLDLRVNLEVDLLQTKVGISLDADLQEQHTYYPEIFSTGYITHTYSHTSTMVTLFTVDT